MQYRRPCRQVRSSLAQHYGCCRRRRGFAAEHAWSVVCAEAAEAMEWGRYLRMDCEAAVELLDHTRTLVTAFFPAIWSASTPPVT